MGWSVIPQVGPGHRYLTGPGLGRGLGHSRIQRAEGTGVLVGRYIRPVRYLHAVRLERRSGVTRIVAPAELPRLGVPSLLIYRP